MKTIVSGKGRDLGTAKALRGVFVSGQTDTSTCPSTVMWCIAMKSWWEKFQPVGLDETILDLDYEHLAEKKNGRQIFPFALMRQ